MAPASSRPNARGGFGDERATVALLHIFTIGLASTRKSEATALMRLSYRGVTRSTGSG